MKNQRIINRIGFLALIFVAFELNALAQEKQVQKTLPNLILETVDGQKWSLYENHGHVVILNFWATWCEPCRAETPMLVKLAGEYEKEGLKVVGVALDQDGTELIKKFAAQYKIDYPILLPAPGSLLSRIDPVPTTLLIDRDVRLAKKYVGAVPEKILRADIEKLIKAIDTKDRAGKKQTVGAKK